jgi:predicted amidohydrolase YtcJ
VKRRASLPFFFLCASGIFSACGTRDPNVPGAATGQAFSSVVVHVSVYDDPAADAVALRGTTIAAIGKSADLSASCRAPCTIVDGKGGFLLPGFHDAHAHLAMTGEEGVGLSVRGGVASVQQTLRTYAAQHPELPWLVGRGWSPLLIARSPTHTDLDAAESVRPVALTDHTAHNLWVNSAALKASGVTRDTPDPPGGKIVHDASGEPTGVFLDSAKSLVLSKAPPPSEDDLVKFIAYGEKVSLGAACTSMQGGPVGLDLAKAYARLDREGKLRQRAFLWAPLLAPEPVFRAWLDFAHSLPREGKVQVVAFKGLADGTFAAHTAALLAPYADDRSVSGPLYATQEQFDGAVLRANRAGFPAAIHAIGDRATRTALDAFERSQKELHHTLVNRVEHATMVDPADTKRFAALHVAASIQPLWIQAGPSRAAFLPDRLLGPSRASRVYPWNDLLKEGALLLFGSDLPVTELNDPVTSIYAAVTRELANGDVFEPAQRIDADSALRATTVNPAVAIGWGDRLGRIAVGHEADLVLLARDPRKGARSLADDPMRQMWISGKLVVP